MPQNKKSGFVAEVKDLYQAWWIGSRGTIWFFVVPLLVILLCMSMVGQLSYWLF